MKNILLIGGSHGIGKELVVQLSKEATVYVASRTTDGLEDTNVTHIGFDVMTDELDVSLLPEQLDGFVYCPGSIQLKPFKRLKPDAFEADMQLNFIGLVKSLQAVLPHLGKSSNASAVFFSTVAASIGMPFHTSVAAAKGAIESFAKALAAEYAPTLRVNVIAPSLTDTPLAEKLLNSDAKKEKMGERHPLQRVGTSKDIAEMANFLLSDKSSWITGQVFAVDGGMSTLNIH